MHPSRTLALFFAAVLLCGGAQAQDADSLQVENLALRTELLRMVEADQAIRHELIEKGIENADSLSRARMDSVDAATQARLEQIIRQHGWPTSEVVGRDGVGAAYTIAQHGDLAFQQQVLPHVRASYERGDLDGQSYALLLDRVLEKEGKPQRYGTQADLRDGKLTLGPLEDSTQVDAWRAELGMMPLEEYVQFLKEMYQIEDSTQ